MGRLFVWKLAIVGVLCAVAPELGLSDDKSASNEDLIGTWEMERARYSRDDGGWMEEPHPLPDPTTLTYHHGWYSLESHARGTSYLKYRVNQAKKPHEIDVWYAENEEEARKKTSRKPDAWGIYEIRENHLWRCFADSKRERPNSFDLVGQEGWTLTVHRHGVER